MFIVLIQTSGNQPYIFGTNKLRENVGASQLTYEAGTKFVLQAIDRTLQPSSDRRLWHESVADRRSRLLNPAINTPIERVDGGSHVEVIYAASGNALLLTNSRAIATTIVRDVTTTALVDAPGLDVLGYVYEFQWTQSLEDAISATYQGFEALRAWRADAQARFASLPILSKCRTSGLPASEERYPDDLSAPSAAKRDASDAWRARAEALFSSVGWTVPPDLDALDQQMQSERWIAVIHADGNGLGAVLQRFRDYLPLNQGADPNRAYADALRAFSLSLDRLAEEAFTSALATLTPLKGGMAPLLPLVLGGDDLTVICTGSQALRFSVAYLEQFETKTRALEGIDHDRLPHLTSCAGIAITKPHFPFYAGYELARELLDSAKAVKRHAQDAPCSALDFHVVFDSSFTNLRRLRSTKLRLSGPPTTHLTAKPYTVSSAPDPAVLSPWARAHQFSDLETRIDALQRRNDEGESSVPSGQLHELRAAIFQGEANAAAQLRLTQHRYADVLRPLLEPQGSLFRNREPVDSGEATGSHRETRFLDALEAANGFWQAGQA